MTHAGREVANALPHPSVDAQYRPSSPSADKEKYAANSISFAQLSKPAAHKTPKIAAPAVAAPAHMVSGPIAAAAYGRHGQSIPAAGAVGAAMPAVSGQLPFRGATAGAETSTALYGSFLKSQAAHGGGGAGPVSGINAVSSRAHLPHQRQSLHGGHAKAHMAFAGEDEFRETIAIQIYIIVAGVWIYGYCS